jgi:hypothetical protein
MGRKGPKTAIVCGTSRELLLDYNGTLEGEVPFQAVEALSVGRAKCKVAERGKESATPVA